MFILGYQGMPRRYYDYVEQFHGGNIISSVGAIILVIGFVTILTNLVKAAYGNDIASKDPWGGKTLEWSVDSPPTVENFDEVPYVEKHPYDYSE